MAKPSREGGCRWRPPSERPPGRHRAPVPPGSAVPPAPGGSTRQLGGHRLPLRAGQLPLRGAGRFGRSPPAETRSAPRPVHVVARTARSRSSPIAATPLATRSRQWATSSMAAGSAATVAPPCLRLVVRVGGRNGRQIAGQQRRSAGSCGRWELAAGSAVDHADLRPATSWLLDLLGHSLRHLVDLAAAPRESTKAAGRWYGPAPHASRALRVPAGPAAPALDPRVPAGPGQGELRAGRCPARWSRPAASAGWLVTA